MDIKFLSVCSGIEAASVAFAPLGWKASGFAEVEPFPSAVLAHHYPDVPNHGDMTALPEKILVGEVYAPDVLCGGTPCQAFSIAGLRGSLSDRRGNLSLTYVEIANAIDTVRVQRGEPECVAFWENVPGVLSTADNAFGCFLAGLAGCDDAVEPGPRPQPGRSSAFWRWSKESSQHVPSWPKSGVVVGPRRTVAWRVLDAQYFGLAQRRRRVFVVASARTGFDSAAVLSEFDGVRRDTAPSRQTGQDPTGPLVSRTSSGGGFGTDFDCAGGLQPASNDRFLLRPVQGNERGDVVSDLRMVRAGSDRACGEVAPPVQRSFERPRGDGIDPLVVSGDVPDVCATLLAHSFTGGAGGRPDGAVGGHFIPVSVTVMAHGQGGAEISEDHCPTLTCNHEAPIAAYLASRVCSTLLAQGNSTGGDRPPGTTVDTCETLVPVAAYGIPGNWIGRKPENGGNAVEPMHDVAPCLTATDRHGVAAYAFQQRIARNGRGDDGDVVSALTAQAGETGKGDSAPCVAILPFDTTQVTSATNGSNPRYGDPSHPLAALGHPPAICIHGTQDPDICIDHAHTLGRNSGQENALATHGHESGMQVRRLTPRECERLQDFPDDYTLIPYGRGVRIEKLQEDWVKYLLRGGVMTFDQVSRAAADGPRYKAIGNSWAVACVSWIGQRIETQLQRDTSANEPKMIISVPAGGK